MSSLIIGARLSFMSKILNKTIRLGLLILVLISSSVIAQSATELLVEAREQAELARSQETKPYNYGQPLWKKAIELAEEAQDKSVNNKEVAAFLAFSYSDVMWWSRAYENWQHYFSLGGSLAEAKKENIDAETMFVRSISEMGYARYQAKDLSAAIPFYKNVLEILPNNTEAIRWLGRIYLEQSNPQEALKYWETLARLEPNDSGAQYFLNLSKRHLKIGIAASEAFETGINAYEHGDFPKALEAFKLSVAANPSYVTAYAWAARTSTDMGQPSLALDFWNRVLELEPNYEGAQYFADIAKSQSRWGAVAANEYFQGQEFYLQGNLVAALPHFEQAYSYNGNFKDAAVWTARVYGELGQPNKAEFYWKKVLLIDPNDKRARDFIRETQIESVYGIDAGDAFVKGVGAFERSQFDEAEKLFKIATTKNPSFAEAWGYLGRLYFTLADYPKAASAYGRALTLDPSSEGYRYFANESLRLANPGQ